WLFVVFFLTFLLFFCFFFVFSFSSDSSMSFLLLMESFGASSVFLLEFGFCLVDSLLSCVLTLFSSSVSEEDVESSLSSGGMISFIERELSSSCSSLVSTES